MIEIAKDIYDRDFEYLPMGKISGRNFLSRQGFISCENPNYMKQGTRYFHYNKIKGYWLGETPVYTSDNRAITA